MGDNTAHPANSSSSCPQKVSNFQTQLSVYANVNFRNVEFSFDKNNELVHPTYLTTVSCYVLNEGFPILYLSSKILDKEFKKKFIGV